MLEFTGERVIPGTGDQNLFNEHLARYRFAAWFAQSVFAQSVSAQSLTPKPVVLDAGCGAGYGSAEFGFADSVTGIDLASDAVHHARWNVTAENVRFVQAACEQLPFADGSFHLITAFEVIEHTGRWHELLTEARRVLKPEGVLLVSTPNKAVYSESRGGAGLNPFHIHEFEPEEFRAALLAVFPHVRVWAQNHAEGISFATGEGTGGGLDLAGVAAVDSSDFVVAACSLAPVADVGSFAFLAGDANVLRERLRHISLLQEEVRQKTQWLVETEAEYAELLKTHDITEAALEERNNWARDLNEQVAKGRERITELERERERDRAGYTGQISALEDEGRSRLEWITDLNRQLDAGRVQIGRLDGELEKFKAAFEERTQWGESMAAELVRQREASATAAKQAAADLDALRSELSVNEQRLATANKQLALIARSKLIRAGRILGLGPKIDGL